MYLACCIFSLEIVIACNVLLGLEQAALKRYPDGIPLLDPVEDMGIEDDKLTAAVRAVEGLELQLAKDPVYQVHLLIGLLTGALPLYCSIYILSTLGTWQTTQLSGSCSLRPSTRHW